MRYLLFRSLFAAAAAVASIAGCSSQSPVAGGSGSTTTNGFTASIVNSQGTPQQNIPVRLRPSDYFASDTALDFPHTAAGTVLDTTTGADGKIAFDNLPPGTYTVEAFDPAGGEGIIIRQEVTAGPVQSLGIMTTRPAGAVEGTVDSRYRVESSPCAVQVAGVERIVPVDPVTGRYHIPDLPPAAYTIRLVSTYTSFVPTVIDTVTVNANDTTGIPFIPDPAYDPYAGYTYTADLIINTADAGLAPGDTLTNFPLLLRLNSENFTFATAKRKGTDFRVARLDNTPVAVEQEWWDSATATAALWILTDTLTGNDADTLRLYWGNSAGGLVSQPTRVFDTLFDYTGVWHLNESGGQEQKDATAHNHSGIPHNMDGANDIPGLIGRAQTFEAKDSQNIVFANIFDTTARDGGNDYAYTVSFWMKTASSTAALPQWLITRSNPQTGIQLNPQNTIHFTGTLQDNATDTCTAPVAAELWTFISAVRKGPIHLLFANGTLTDSTFSLSRKFFGDAESDDGSLQLGSLGGTTGWFDGTIDELRWSRKPRSAAWIRLCYETQREAETAITISNIAKR